jgi:type VI secretion system protein ImpA
VEASIEQNSLDFCEDFIRIDAAICEYDSVGNAPQRKGESGFQWASVETACVALLKRAKDIRVAIWYVRACMARRGLSGLAEGIRALADIMRLPVSEIHPRAQADEAPGESHVIHLGWIGGQQFLHQLGCICLDGHDVTVSDLARGHASAIVKDRSYRAALHRLLCDIQDSFSGIEASMATREQRIDLSRVLDLLEQALSRLPASPDNDGAVLVEMPRVGADPQQQAVGVLRTRKEVGAALDRMVEYFRVHEPSHPAPIFLSRVQRMLGADFEEVMAELYSEAVSLVAQLDRPEHSSK